MSLNTPPLQAVQLGPMPVLLLGELGTRSSVTNCCQNVALPSAMLLQSSKYAACLAKASRYMLCTSLSDNSPYIKNTKPVHSTASAHSHTTYLARPMAWAHCM
eukprot:GHRR01026619.1.p2 GENE.GHRR01026619.1~~GHRR01026619.1.p2  ORF type:complete len:103 (+),score=17.07 GHRR01026619.1:539-847(+)